MRSALAILLVVAIAIAWWFWREHGKVVESNNALTSALESSEEKLRVQEENFEAQQEAMDTLRETHAEVVAQNTRYERAFDGFSARLETDPEIESRINCASQRALQRVLIASGGPDTGRVEC